LEKDKAMSKSQSILNISDSTLRDAIKKEYENVAVYPNKGYHFHTGREAANRIGYDKMLYDSVPEKNIASFAGTGNPFYVVQWQEICSRQVKSRSSGLPLMLDKIR
jgi:hypothetical protein